MDWKLRMERHSKDFRWLVFYLQSCLTVFQGLKTASVDEAAQDGTIPVKKKKKITRGRGGKRRKRRVREQEHSHRGS